MTAQLDMFCFLLHIPLLYSLLLSSNILLLNSLYCCCIAEYTPPGEAHMSNTWEPGTGASTCATTALGRFCSIPKPGSMPWQGCRRKTLSVISTPMPLVSLNMFCLENLAMPLPVCTVLLKACSHASCMYTLFETTHVLRCG